MKKTLSDLFEEAKPKMYKKLIATLGAKRIYEVDGEWIRDYKDIGFTNAGQHYQYKYIPKYEIWIDRAIQPDERRFFIDNMIVQRRLMKRGKSFSKAEDAGHRKEKAERIRSAGTARSVKEYEDSDPLKLKIKLLKNIDGVNVWLVRAKKVRDAWPQIEYAEGGHGYVYGFIPNKEVWIGDDIFEDERKFIMLHEFTERQLMKDKKWNYDKAHNEANRVEHLSRKLDEFHPAA